MTGRAQRDKNFPTFEQLTGRGSTHSAQEMSATMMVHNIQLWRHALGQGGDAQQQGG